jgi:lipoate-protein ligase A
MKDYPLTAWRLIETPPASGAWNMAVDEAILEAVGRGDVPATLRLYAWEPACLSIGYAQSTSDVDLEALDDFGWDLVRRPTGGRAILHTDELTYAVIGPKNDPRLTGSVVDSYQKISRALLHAIKLLEVNADTFEVQDLDLKESDQIRKTQNPVCFEVPSNYEITVGGKKLIGSAQARRKGGVLQHGSLPLGGDLTRVTRVLDFPDQDARSDAAARLLDRAATMEHILGYDTPWESVVQAFTTAFGEALQLNLQETDLTKTELDRANELIQEKYSHPSWTYRV